MKMDNPTQVRQSIGNYLSDLNRSLTSAKVTAAGCDLSLQAGIEQAIDKILAAKAKSAKVILIGNGGSAAIASHQAMDLWRSCGVRAIAFNDAVQLTCLGNDFGYENIFSRPIQMFAEEGDILIAVSSSGRSANILGAVQAAREKKCVVITFSGFAPDNPLRASGDLNFYIDSHAYGFVEVSHLTLIHALSDFISKG